MDDDEMARIQKQNQLIYNFMVDIGVYRHCIVRDKQVRKVDWMKNFQLAFKNLAQHTSSIAAMTTINVDDELSTTIRIFPLVNTNGDCVVLVRSDQWYSFLDGDGEGTRHVKSLDINPYYMQKYNCRSGLWNITENRAVLCVLFAVLVWRFQATDPHWIIDGLIHWWQLHVMPYRAGLADDIAWSLQRWVYDLAHEGEATLSPLYGLGLISGRADSDLRIPSHCGVEDCQHSTAMVLGLNVCGLHLASLFRNPDHQLVVFLTETAVRRLPEPLAKMAAEE